MPKVDLNSFKKNIIAAARKGLEVSALEVEKHLKDNVNLTDHTQEDLDNLGNPYGFRNPKTIHDPDWLVHNQTGQLHDSITVTKENENTYSIGADPNIRDKDGISYLNKVIDGTSKKMRARNFPLHTLEEMESFNIIDDLIDTELGKVTL